LNNNTARNAVLNYPISWPTDYNYHEKAAAMVKIILQGAVWRS
jgi:hypothetical protein